MRIAAAGRVRGVKNDVFWSALEAAGSAIFSVAAAFIVARLIGPSELGIGATVVAVHVLLWVAVNALFADAIVQRCVIGDTMLCSAAWASAAVGCAAAVAQIVSGWLLAWMLGDNRLIGMAVVLALPLPVVGLGGAFQGLLTRHRNYRGLAARTLIGQGIGMAIGILLASHHAGAWAPVLQQAAGSLISALVLVCITGWWPRRICRWSLVRSLLRIGIPLTASTLLQISRYRVFAILIGGIAGPAALGQIHVAFRLADTVREITFTALWRLLLPILAEHQRDRAALLLQVDRLLSLSSAVTMPLCGAMAITLVPLTTLMMGPTWQLAGVAAVPLVAVTALLALMLPSGTALVAVGQARFTMYANVAGVAATVAFVLIVRPETPWTAVLVWCGAQAFVSPFSLWANGRALGVGPLRPLRAGVPMLLISLGGVGAAMTLPVEDPFWMLISRLTVFLLVVVPCARVLLRPARASKPEDVGSDIALAGKLKVRPSA